MVKRNKQDLQITQHEEVVVEAEAGAEFFFDLEAGLAHGGADSTLRISQSIEFPIVLTVEARAGKLTEAQRPEARFEYRDIEPKVEPDERARQRDDDVPARDAAQLDECRHEGIPGKMFEDFGDENRVEAVVGERHRAQIAGDGRSQYRVEVER